MLNINFPEPPLVIRTTKQIVMTVLRKEVHGNIHGGNNEDSDDSSNNGINMDPSASSNLKSDIEMLAPAC